MPFLRDFVLQERQPISERHVGPSAWEHGDNRVKEKASKGESQERCRNETSPARIRGEENARRVTKP